MDSSFSGEFRAYARQDLFRHRRRLVLRRQPHRQTPAVRRYNPVLGFHWHPIVGEVRRCFTTHGGGAELGRLNTPPLVGLPDGTIKESRDHITAAVTNSGFAFPIRHITTILRASNKTLI